MTYKSWAFWLENLWELIIDNIELIAIINGELNSLPILNHQHYNGSQQDSGKIALFLHCLIFLHELFWVFRPNMFVTWNIDHIHYNIK